MSFITKKNKPDDQDPDALFDYLIEDAKKSYHPHFKKSYKNKNLIPWIIASCLVLGILGLFSWMIIHFQNKSQDPFAFVYFDVKAIDQNGRTLSGAQIYINNNFEGYTDSFGEWKKYIKEKRGASIDLRLSKKNSRNPKDELAYQKKYSVPREVSSHDVEFKETIRLVGEEKPEIREQKSENRNQRTEIREQKSESREQKSESREQTNLPVSFQLSLNKNNITRKDQLTFMQNKFLPKIKSKMKELGLQEKKSSNWEIHIKLLKNSSDKQSSGLLLVSSELKNENKTHGNKFLVNLTMNEDQLSQKILLALRSHIPTSFTVVKNSQQWKAEMKSDDPLFWQLRKGTPLINSIGKHFVVGSNVKNKNSFQLHALNSSSPCLDQEDSCLLYSKTVPEYSPWPGAIKLKIKLTQKNQFHDSNLNSRDVYVSGFLAKNLAPHVYSYWGRPGEKVFVTVIHRDQIVYREEIVSKKEQLPVIALDQLSKKKI